VEEISGPTKGLARRGGKRVGDRQRGVRIDAQPLQSGGGSFSSQYRAMSSRLANQTLPFCFMCQ
jgi:hypothetical protein